METIYIDINELDEYSGLFANSFVGAPAVGIDKISFSEELKFAADKPKQNFMGVSLLADVPLKKRHPGTGEIVNIVFTAETIQKLVKKFVTSPHQHVVNYNHNGQAIQGVTLVEHFIYDPQRINFSENFFPGITPGSWVTTYHVENLELFEKLEQDPNFNGFSVEIYADLSKNNTEIDKFSKMKAILSDDDMEIEDMWNKVEELLNE